ncbi:unnamed protein product [Tuber melanosporum]|uniref:Calcium-channel protein CCH1 n=1 Tax=Tuber melanosporum (strain Mel28) TaxID=656061 RepID=D5GC92_TUBMM|nr:uncharacterized protein GSTUM_00000580001 [Tuber melanosporum]CAZ82135.1 unnamed protein product [Tuber melanosporum]
MASNSRNPSKPPSPEPIPLQDLSRPPDSQQSGSGDTGLSYGVGRSRSLLRGTTNLGAEIGRRISLHRHRGSYDRVPEERLPPRLEVPDLQLPQYDDGEMEEPNVVEFAEGFVDASGERRGGRSGSWLPPRNLERTISPWAVSDDDEPPPVRPYYGVGDDDTARLTDPSNVQPMSRSDSSLGHRRQQSSRSMRFGPGPSLGDDLLSAEEGMNSGVSKMKGGTRSRSGSVAGGTPSRSGSLSKSRSLSPGASPVRRVSVAVQNMSQRVVGLSNDPEAVIQGLRRRSSSKSHADGPVRPNIPAIQIHPQDDIDTSDAEEKPTTPLRRPAPSPGGGPWRVNSNPLRGNTLRIFSPSNPLRLFLCDVLVHPATEPLILLLILIQTILLAIDAAPSIYEDPRSKSWGTSNIDYALLVLFSIYTVEIIARCIVSGVFLNPRAENDPKGRGELRRRVMEGTHKLLSPRRKPSVRAPSPSRLEQPPSLLRSLTSNLQLADRAIPVDGQCQVRLRMARRAFLRHSFNRLDFVAVVSYWISLWLCITGVEAERHLYVFRMMSCLRILRLLGITSGTSVILRSLKKAAPLLVNVALLIGFFWLIFAIIGVQSFKSSFRRSCVWVDPEGVQRNFTQEFQFCGGHRNRLTGLEEPYVYEDGTPGTRFPKGYICPANSFCVSSNNPYGGTVSFDNIAQSLELVFVVMTANTFSNLLYYMADSDYLTSALCESLNILYTNLNVVLILIAVITSSFQVIREESRKSAFAAEEDTSSKVDEEELVRKPNPLKNVYDRTFYVWVTVISVGIFAQAFRSSNMSRGRETVLGTVELGVTLVLALEILLRFMADWRNFRRKTRNLVDLALALITCIIQIPPIHKSGRIYDWLTLFQILRVYRVVWAIPVTRNLLSKVIGNVSGLTNLIIFVLLLTFLCAIFAVQIVRGDLPEEYQGDTTAASFHTIFNAFLGMYQIFSSEDWTTILYMATDVQRPYNVGWITAIFFIGWFILGNFIVLNMFIAVVQENFDVTEDEKRIYQVKTFLQNKDYSAPSQGISLSNIFGFGKQKTKEPHSRQAAFEMLTKQAVVESFLDEGAQQPRQPVTRAQPLHAAAEDARRTGDVKQRPWERMKNRLLGVLGEKEPNPFYSFALSRSIADLTPTAMAQQVVTEQERRRKAQREYLRKYPNYNVPLHIFRSSNPIRRLCQRMVGPSRASIRYDGLQPYTPFSYAFSILVYCAIVSMVIIACITTPLYQKEYFEKHGSSLRNWFTFADAGFVALFTIESLIKIVADGLIWTPNAYLRGSWGVIDCVVLITLWISVITSFRNQGEISRAVGAFKALRALRLLNISGAAQNTFHSVVILGGRKILSAAFVSLSLIIPFAIYGVNLFSGLLDTCNDDSEGIANLTSCVHEYSSTPYDWGVLAPRAVDNPYFNFDNFGSSLFILFQIVSQEGWTGVMFDVQAIVGKGQQPRPFSSQANSIFFLAFNLLGAVFVLTLFVSVFMRNYTEQTGVAYLTSDQRSWLELRKLLRQIRPSRRPKDSPDLDWKSWCYKRATHKHGWWQRTYTVVLVLHAILLLLEHHPAPPALDRTRDWIFLGFSGIFVGNLVVRVIGLTWSNFLKSRWDIYAIISVNGTFVTTLLLLAGYQERTFIQLQKLFLVSIVMMLIPRNDDLDHLFKTAAASLTAIGNLMATWFVLFLVYAIALTQTFGLTRIGPNGNGNMNFRTVPKALILLFRMTCGEGWNQIMSDFEVSHPNCVYGENFYESDCGSQGYARALFVSWNILSMYIFVSMFISLIFESFSYVFQRSGGSSVVSRPEIRKFKQAWQQFDPDGTGYISKENFPRLLGTLTGIFAMRVYEEPFTVPDILDDCRVDPQSHSSGTTRGIIEGVDLEALNRRVAMIPIHKIRRQRHIYTLFYEECLVSADKEYGVSFTSVLLILAHYKIINDNRSLRLEEYLRRRYRLQRVEEQVQRNIVTNFFLSLYWNKRFKDRHRAHSGAPQVPQIFVDDVSSSRPNTGPNVPQILVDGGEASLSTSSTSAQLHEGPVTPKRQAPPPLDLDYHVGNSRSPETFGISSTPQIGDSDPFASPFSAEESPSVLRQRLGRGRSPDVSPSLTPNESPNMSPNGSPVGSPRLSPIATTSGWISRAGSVSVGGGSPSRSRADSDVVPQNVLEVLGSSEWGDQIRSYIGRSGDQSSTRSSQGGNAGPR